jgi:hypothetical protein
MFGLFTHGRKVTEAQMRLGRLLEMQGIINISKFIRACERGEYEKIEKWKKEIRAGRI